MLNGLGYHAWIDDQGQLRLGRPAKMDLQIDAKIREVKGYPYNNPTGRLQVVDAEIEEETYNCILDTQSFDKHELSRVFDQRIRVSSSITLPCSMIGQIPTTAPYEIDVPGLLEDQQVGCFIELPIDNPKLLRQTTVVNPPTGTYKVSANTITFNATEAGSSVVYQYFRTYTDIETMGAEAGKALGELQFFGRLIGPRFKIGAFFYIPRLVRASGATLGKEDAKMTYKCILKPPFALPIITAYDVPES
jgi:hypothetical protein